MSTTDLAKLARPYTEALCAYEALRRWGFEAKQLRLHLVSARVAGTDWQGFTAGEEVPHLVVAAERGGERFDIICGPVREEPAELLSIWRAATTTWNDASKALRQGIWEKSTPGARFVQLGRALRGQGFMLPATPRTAWGTS